MVDVQFTHRAVVDGPVTTDPDAVRFYRNRVRLMNSTATPSGLRWAGALRKQDLIEVSAPTAVSVSVIPTGQEQHG
jgi:hypothetical protein